MAEIVFTSGKQAKAQSSRGAKVANERNRWMYRVSGEVVTSAQIQQRTGLTKEAVSSFITKRRAKGVPLTWEGFAAYRTTRRKVTT